MDGSDIVYLAFNAQADSESLFFGMSMGKTVTAMGVGQASCAGKLTLQSKALGNPTVHDLLRYGIGCGRAERGQRHLDARVDQGLEPGATESRRVDSDGSHLQGRARCLLGIQTRRSVRVQVHGPHDARPHGQPRYWHTAASMDPRTGTQSHGRRASGAVLARPCQERVGQPVNRWSWPRWNGSPVLRLGEVLLFGASVGTRPLRFPQR